MSDESGGISLGETPVPNLDAKLVGRRAMRGWGLFLIEPFVAEVRIRGDEGHHTTELIMRLPARQ